MSLDIKKFERNPIQVQGVQVTKTNMEEVAKWCDGEIVGTGKQRHIEVRTTHPRTRRQSQAFAGDYVLYSESGYKVYRGPTFRKMFTEMEPEVHVDQGRLQDEMHEIAANGEMIPKRRHATFLDHNPQG